MSRHSSPPSGSGSPHTAASRCIRGLHRAGKVHPAFHQVCHPYAAVPRGAPSPAAIPRCTPPARTCQPPRTSRRAHGPGTFGPRRHRATAGAAEEAGPESVLLLRLFGVFPSGMPQPSGAINAGNFISGALCRQLRLKLTATPKVYQVHTVAGRPLRTVRNLAGPLHFQATPVESSTETRTPDILACYSRFQDVFCPRKASKLPPHRPWDCAIDLIPGEPVPKGWIYSLSIPEERAMEEYIQEALSQGYIHPSTSPAASSFFFVAKKDGSLRPCIDYRALNQITVKFRYPLPLVPSVLEHLYGATVCTKLDLCSAFNLIRI
ncbi:hypothetical protein QTP70_002632 [Hemibagrus guttatus]|uniref:Reverse transcriptase domain-containing protein n=1 Tax=Hemibagrus guttatus TaxID=175788 RepID=A0AAE0V5K0_9TELE|nr:hypothetical protein QTP70_002632 [Hemibagrus guttatus]